MSENRLKRFFDTYYQDHSVVETESAFKDSSLSIFESYKDIYPPLLLQEKAEKALETAMIL